MKIIVSTHVGIIQSVFFLLYRDVAKFSSSWYQIIVDLFVLGDFKGQFPIIRDNSHAFRQKLPNPLSYEACRMSVRMPLPFCDSYPSLFSLYAI
jgi:hypothetical protein